MNPDNPYRPRRGALHALAAALVLLLAACGGAGLPDVVRTGGTGSPKATVAAGPITGLGSIVVNGVRFDEAGAEVTINGVAGRPVSELQLGMMVEVRGEVDIAARTGKATSVVATALLAGPVGAVDLSRGEVTLLGQRVEVKTGTVLQGASTLASIRPGDAVVVYGFWDFFANHVDATRLEVRAASAPPPTAILGKISSVAGTRVQMGSLVVETAGAALVNLPGGLAAGSYVEALGTLAASGVLQAQTLTGRSEFSPVEGIQTEIEGYVTDFAGLASFRVLGLPVNATNARLAGLTGSLANGALVEVEGQVTQGVLVANLLEVKSGPQQPAVPTPTTVAGVVTDFVSVASFRVRDQAVDATGATFTGGTAASLANGRTVEVTGLVNGNVLVAGSVVFSDPPVPAGTRVVVSGAIELYASPANFRVNGQATVATQTTVYSGGTAADLANGRKVTVDGMLTSGVLTAWWITFAPVETVTTVSLAGVITDYVSPASFRVNNQAIATDGATVFENGTAARLANGQRVEVEGRLAGGVVTATKVQFAESTPTEEAEVEGTIQVFVSVANFTVKGQVIDASAASFQNGRPSDLARGVKVHVKGPVSQGVLRARQVEIDD